MIYILSKGTQYHANLRYAHSATLRKDEDEVGAGIVPITRSACVCIHYKWVVTVCVVTSSSDPVERWTRDR
jgi:hypothetical protein